MHLYIDHLKNSPTTRLDKTEKDKIKTEFEGLTHLMELTSALDNKMGDWQNRLSSLGNTLVETQKMIAGISGELGTMRLGKDGVISKTPTTSVDSSSLWFWVMTIVAIIGSILFFDPCDIRGRLIGVRNKDNV